MRQFSASELKTILELHEKWLNNEFGGIRADLSGSDLRYSDLRNSDLRYSDLSGSKNVPIEAVLLTTILPEGDIIGYKKCNVGINYAIVKILVPSIAKRSNATGRKCRCNTCKVLEINSIDYEIKTDTVTSQYDKSFIYKVGDTLTVDNFDDTRWNECSTGIHFFITKEEAIRY